MRAERKCDLRLRRGRGGCGWWFGLGMLRNYVKENSVGREKSGQKGKRLGSEERKQPYCFESALPT